MSSVPKLTISLVNTNNRDLLRACLQSLYSVDHSASFEVILVDNLSTDGSREMVAAEFSKVQLVLNGARQGFGANHNQAIRRAKGEYILVLNEDTIVRAGALKAMADYLDADSAAGAVGCRLENPDGTLQPSCYRFPSPGRSVAENLLLVAAFPDNRFWGDYRAWAHDDQRYVDFVSGAAIMVRREVIETVGTFDEQFFIYAEETDWCYRMSKARWKVAFTPAGTIVHYGGQSSVAFKDRQFCEFNRSATKYFRKHHGRSGVAVNHLAMLVGSIVRIPLWLGIFLIFERKRQVAAQRLRLWSRIFTWTVGFRGRGLAPSS